MQKEVSDQISLVRSWHVRGRLYLECEKRASDEHLEREKREELSQEKLAQAILAVSISRHVKQGRFLGGVKILSNLL